MGFVHGSKRAFADGLGFEYLDPWLLKMRRGVPSDVLLACLGHGLYGNYSEWEREEREGRERGRREREREVERREKWM